MLTYFPIQLGNLVQQHIEFIFPELLKTSIYLIVFFIIMSSYAEVDALKYFSIIISYGQFGPLKYMISLKRLMYYTEKPVYQMFECTGPMQATIFIFLSRLYI